MSVVVIRTPNGSGDFLPERLNIRLANATEGSDKAWDDRFTDDLGQTAWPGLDAVMRDRFPNMVGKGHTLYVNFANVNPRFKTATLFVQNLERDGAHVVIEPAPQCPVNYDKTQFTDWFNQVKVGNVVTTENMAAMAAEVRKCGMFWQNQEFFPADPSKWRPRIHQPPIRPDHDSDHNVDCGDFGGPWTLTFRY